MVQYRKPPQRSKNIIDLRVRSGAEGRATNRVRTGLRRDAKQNELNDLAREALNQAIQRARRHRAGTGR